MLYSPLFYIVENSQIQYRGESVFVVPQLEAELTQQLEQKTFSVEAKGTLK
jgi:hypothetical protein